MSSPSQREGRPDRRFGRGGRDPEVVDDASVSPSCVALLRVPPEGGRIGVVLCHVGGGTSLSSPSQREGRPDRRFGRGGRDPEVVDDASVSPSCVALLRVPPRGGTNRLHPPSGRVARIGDSGGEGETPRLLTTPVFHPPASLCSASPLEGGRIGGAFRLGRRGGGASDRGLVFTLPAGGSPGSEIRAGRESGPACVQHKRGVRERSA